MRLLLLLALALGAVQAGAMSPVGEGTLRWFGLKIYDARLWTPGGAPDFSRQICGRSSL